MGFLKKEDSFFHLLEFLAVKYVRLREECLGERKVASFSRSLLLPVTMWSVQRHRSVTSLETCFAAEETGR